LAENEVGSHFGVGFSEHRGLSTALGPGKVLDERKPRKSSLSHRLVMMKSLHRFTHLPFFL
jgi:hypothetical protein